MGPLEPILKTTGLADAGRVAPVVSISGSSPHPGIPGLILGAQSSLLNKLMTVWPFAFSQICGSRAQNSKQHFKTQA